MPSDVQMSIESIVQVFGNKSEIDAKKYVLNMQLNKRYVVECWSWKSMYGREVRTTSYIFERYVYGVCIVRMIYYDK